jgi:nucleotidyltransferase substrate binding protein (TIGR01987 family)
VKETLRLHGEHRDNQSLQLALRDSCIHRFEYTYELAWQLIQRWIRENIDHEAAQVCYTRRELFRHAARAGLIEDPLVWFEFHKARKISAHVHDENQAKFVVIQISLFVFAAEKLIMKLESAND